MSTTNCVIKVCSNNYYTVIKWIEGMSSTLAPRNCVCSTLDPISAVRESWLLFAKDLKEWEWIKFVSTVTWCY